MIDPLNSVRRLGKLIEDDNRGGDNLRAEAALARLDDAFIKFWIDTASGQPNDHRVVLFDALVDAAHTIRCPKKLAHAIEIIGDSGLRYRPRGFERFKQLLDRQAGGRSFQLIIPDDKLEEEVKGYWRKDRIAREKIPTSYSYTINPIIDAIGVIELIRVLKENNAIGFSFERGLHTLYFQNEVDEIMARISFPNYQPQEV